MRKALAAVVLLSLSPLVQADEGWKGSGELGLALSRGNSETESLNAKLGLSYEDERRKHSFGFAALRQKGEVAGASGLQLTANRYELSGSSAYKFTEQRYMVGSLRYENDDFAPFDYQAVGSLNYGWYAIREERTELQFEGGPGYRRVREVASGQSEGDLVLRARSNFRHAFNDNTSFENTLLVESGSDNTYAQNDSGLVVKMNSRLALKSSLQFRHNSEAAAGLKKTDSLFTTNLVYSF